jgi:hypothetical protein
LNGLFLPLWPLHVGVPFTYDRLPGSYRFLSRMNMRRRRRHGTRSAGASRLYAGVARQSTGRDRPSPDGALRWRFSPRRHTRVAHAGRPWCLAWLGHGRHPRRHGCGSWLLKLCFNLASWCLSLPPGDVCICLWIIYYRSLGLMLCCVGCFWILMAAPTTMYIDGKLASWFFRPHQPAQGGGQQPAAVNDPGNWSYVKRP